MNTYDSIVIGAGNGGLVGALNLAKSGRKVLLLEKHNIPGGCATSFIRGRFEFDVSLHTLYGIGTDENKGLLRKLFEELGVYDKLELIPQNELFHLQLLGQMDLSLPYHRDAFLAVMETISPDEKEALHKYQKFLNDLTDEFYRLYDELGGEINSEKFPLLFEYGTRAGQEVLDEYFEHPLVKLIYTMNFGYAGIPIDRIPIVILALMYELKGGHHVKGGAQAISNVMINEFERCGGAVIYNAEVSKIQVEDNRVTGVEVVDGRLFHAPSILCNASKIRTYVDLIDEDHVPEDTFLNLKVSTPGVSTFGLYLGLNCTAEEAGFEHGVTYLIDATVPPNSYEVDINTLDNVKAAYMSCYNHEDPDYSPEGTCALNICLSKTLEPWLKMSPESYFENKYKLAEKVLDLLDKFYPKARAHIEELEVSTPLTHMRYLGAPGGAIYATQCNFKDLLANKLEVKSPIEGLYFCGSPVLTGGFNTTYMSGKAVSSVMLKDMAAGR